jgi:ribose transport system permease protein
MLLVNFAQTFGLLAVILIVGLVLTIASPHFLTRINLINVLYASSLIAVVALGETFVILVAGIDLSVGSVVALTSVLAAGLVLNQKLPTGVAIVAALGVGALFGLANGLATTRLRISPLIATLATLSIARGLAFIYSGGTNIAPVPNFFTAASTANVLGIPVVIIFALALAVVAQLILSRTRFGRSIYATGGNRLAARLAGIRTDRIILFAFTLSGLTAGIGGLVITARLGAGAATAAQGLELAVIAAVVIGGTSLFGGEGSIGGVLLGVLLLALVQNGVNLLNVPPNYDTVVSGLVIAAAAAVDVYRRGFLEQRLSRRSRGTDAVEAVPVEAQGESGEGQATGAETARTPEAPPSAVGRNINRGEEKQ